MIDVLGLRVLIALRDAGSVTAAAHTLGYTASNITQHLRRIERTLGTPMVERVGRGVVLTERAQTLVERGRPLLLQLDDLASTTTTAPAGDLHLAAFPTALRGMVIPALAAVSAEHPNLKVRPRELEPAAAIDAVGRGHLHAAIVKTWGRVSRAGGNHTLEHIALGTDRIDAVVPRSHPLAEEDVVALEQLANENWAVTPERDPYNTWLAEHRQPLELNPPTTYEATEFASLIDYVRHGLAVAAIPRLGRGDLHRDVVAVPLSDPTAVRQISLVVRSSSRGGPAIEALITQLKATAADTLEHA